MIEEETVQEEKPEHLKRFDEAVAADDSEYLQDFSVGRDMAFQNIELNTEADLPQGVRDGYTSGAETRASLEDGSAIRNKVYVQPHALGGLEVIVFGSDGNQTSARIPVEAATSLAAVLNMWIVTLLQQSFFETVQAAKTESGIVIPGR